MKILILSWCGGSILFGAIWATLGFLIDVRMARRPRRVSGPAHRALDDDRELAHRLVS